MKKILIFIFLITSLFSFASCKKEKENKEFNKYLDELFYEFLGNDPISINSVIVNTKNYNIEEYDVTAYSFNEQDEKEYYDNLKSIKDKLSEFKKLTKEQELSRKILIDYLNRNLAFEDLFYYQSNFGSYLGYQAQLPIILAEYRFDDLYDIESYFNYLKTTKTTFTNMINYEREKINKNLGMNKIIINGVIDQINNFLSLEGSYLIANFEKKINELNFLNETQRNSLIIEHNDIIENEFLDAYSYLKSELKTLNASIEGTGIGNLPDGKKYYQALFNQATGTDYTIEEAKQYLEGKISELIKSYNIFYSQKYEVNLMSQNNYNDLMTFFLDKSKSNFPKLPYNLNYEIKTIDKSLENNSSPAMYFISPIDKNIKEIIYVNNRYFQDDKNYVYKTMAHEGIPGHMYQNVYLKNLDIPNVRKIIHYSGYSEGWATYVENYVISYVDNTALKAFEFYDTLSYLYLGILDIGINYEGWSIEEASKYLMDLYKISNKDAEDLYYQLIEVPTNYLEYFFSYYQVQDLKTYFKGIMGNKYSDYLFHKIYLDTGPAPFSILKEQYKNHKL